MRLATVTNQSGVASPSPFWVARRNATEPLASTDHPVTVPTKARLGTAAGEAGRMAMNDRDNAAAAASASSDGLCMWIMGVGAPQRILLHSSEILVLVAS